MIDIDLLAVDDDDVSLATLRRFARDFNLPVGERGPVRHAVRDAWEKASKRTKMNYI